MSDWAVATILTVLAMLFNIVAGTRAGYYSFKVDDCDWLCKRGSRRCSTRILLGSMTLCFYLALLKSWAVQDVFLRYWDNMPATYHMRSFAFLGENFMVPMMAWLVTTYVVSISGCTRYERRKRQIEIEGRDRRYPRVL